MYNNAQLGGAIYANETQLSMEEVAFTGNIANDTGGALYVLNSTVVSKKHVHYKQNIAPSHDGGGKAVCARNVTYSSPSYICKGRCSFMLSGE